MRHSRNIIVVPPHYKGTSFADIVFALQFVVRKKHLSIEFVGELRPLSNTIPVGQLDDSRFVTKNDDVMRKLLQYPDRTNFLFLDFYALGLDMLLYSHSQKGIHNCHYGALVHGGAFLADDLYSWSWLKQFEHAWALSLHKLYVPSQHLFRHLPENWKDRTRVFPWGMDGIHTTRGRGVSTFDVVFPHRLDSDKGVDNLLGIARRIPELSFALTTPQTKQRFIKNPVARQLKNLPNIHVVSNLDSADHIKTLQGARVVLSCATQENFGYAIMKSVMAGCIPVVPNRLCYPEFLPSQYRYNSINDAVQKIKYFTSNWDTEMRNRKIEHARNKISCFTFASILHDFFRM